MRHRWPIIALAALAGIAFAGAAIAERGSDRKGRHFESRDTDGDGSVSLSEWSAACESRFEALDVDGDGAITAQEWSDARKQMREKRRQADR